MHPHDAFDPLAAVGSSAEYPAVEPSGFRRYLASFCLASAGLASAGLASALQGCAPDIHASCSSPPRTTAIVRLAFIEGHAVIPLEVDKKVIEAVLDTGAYASILTGWAATALDRRPVPRAGGSAMESLAISGLGGSTYAQVLVVRDLLLAGARLETAVFLDVPSLDFTDPRLAGLVGGDLLSSWDLDLDVSRGLLQLDLPQSGPPVQPWKGSTTVVPLEAPHDTLIRISAMLDGRELHAVIDTGASTSIVGPATAAGQGVLHTDKWIVVRGVAGRRLRVQRHRYSDLSIGGLSFGPIDVAVGPIGIDDVDMVIGLDVLSMTRFYVAYQAHTLMIDEGTH